MQIIWQVDSKHKTKLLANYLIEEIDLKESIKIRTMSKIANWTVTLMILKSSL